ncbi:type II/IV secretion system protein [Pseudoclavibacter sp. CFCC 13796]|uniref:GspE/PulE family protein n=1 Tax=Pseudoclavibacter sp. CFCC 13796 TaxID=2615179 RepID=UPI0013018CCD|nr:GspE/PulE family protein [Pseudoclavibacter sp. CFCC 13796]KAB1661596.1 type II/IV secretion system protein [Pseudoclavibacter sp. CFCC 13796]
MNSNPLLDALQADGVAASVIARVPDESAQSSSSTFTWLLDNGGVDDVRLSAVASAVSRLPIADVPSPSKVDRDAARLIPGKLAKRFALLSVADDGHTMDLVVSNPFDRTSINECCVAAGRRARLSVAPRSKILETVTEIYRSDQSEALDSLGEDLKHQLAAQRSDTSDDRPGDDSPVARLVNVMIQQAIDDGASDIHIQPTDDDVVVRHRIDGVLRNVTRHEGALHSALINRLKIISSLDIATRNTPQDGRFSSRTTSGTVDIRLALFPTVHGEAAVMRLLTHGSSPMSIEDQEFAPGALASFRSAYHSSFGLVLVTGPTGSGKSTTLHAALSDINDPAVNIITVEDPVEFRYPGVNQIQVNEKQNLTFASALRSILRADPDVLLVGELRDKETASIAINAALTGHLVLSTLHTNDASGAVGRLVEMGVKPFLLSSALRAVVGQRLLRRLCPQCRRTVTVTLGQLRTMGFGFPADADPALRMTVYEPGGCERCDGTGYLGRLAIREVMPVDEQMALMIATGRPKEELQAHAVAHGMDTMRMDGLRKARAGSTSLAEILRVVG